MKLLLLAVVSLIVVPAASANRGHHHSVDPTFTCDGVTCTYTATGLVPGALYSPRITLTGANGLSRNVGASLSPADSSGTYVFTGTESFMLGQATLPATGSAWLTQDDSSWGSPVVPGTLIPVSV